MMSVGRLNRLLPLPVGEVGTKCRVRDNQLPIGRFPPHPIGEGALTGAFVVPLNLAERFG
jgi:hypothetical protein